MHLAARRQPQAAETTLCRVVVLGHTGSDESIPRAANMGRLLTHRDENAMDAEDAVMPAGGEPTQCAPLMLRQSVNLCWSAHHHPPPVAASAIRRAMTPDAMCTTVST